MPADRAETVTGRSVPRHARLGLLLSLLLLSGLLVGCTPADSPHSASSASSALRSRGQRAQQVVDDFVAAARRGDTGAAAALVSAQDQAFGGRAAAWAANLHRTDWSRMTWTVQSTGAASPGAHPPAQPGEAWVQHVTISWSLPTERRAATDDVWLTFVDEQAADGTRATRLAGDSDGPAASTVPIWLQQPVRLLRDHGVLVLTGSSDASSWLSQASAARRAVAKRITTAPRGRGDVLVVEVPQSRAVFERILGVRAGSYAAVAAAAWPMGPDTTTAPIHVVVNPEASSRLSTLGRNVLLTHEAVHVATRSPGSSAPTWLVEGYADQVAYDAYPAGTAPAEDAVRAAVREHGAPQDWPAEKDFAPDAADLDLAYDLAWTAVRSIAVADGGTALDRLYAAADRGDSMTEAAEELGSSEQALRKQWRRDLEAMAAR